MSMDSRCVPVEIGRTRDSDIRVPLIAWLRRLHPADDHTEIIEELKVPRPSARVDVAVVNGELAGFEIKSDLDSLRRLETQIPAFCAFFDRVSLVTTKRHLIDSKRTVPQWWGIVTLTDTPGIFRVVRKARRNPEPQNVSLLYSLTSSELQQMLALKGVACRRAARKDALVSLAQNSLTFAEIREAARSLIRLRVNDYTSDPSPVS